MPVALTFGTKTIWINYKISHNIPEEKLWCLTLIAFFYKDKPIFFTNRSKSSYVEKEIWFDFPAAIGWSQDSTPRSEYSDLKISPNAGFFSRGFQEWQIRNHIPAGKQRTLRSAVETITHRSRFAKIFTSSQSTKILAQFFAEQYRTTLYNMPGSGIAFIENRYGMLNGALFTPDFSSRNFTTLNWQERIDLPQLRAHVPYTQERSHRYNDYHRANAGASANVNAGAGGTAAAANHELRNYQELFNKMGITSAQAHGMNRDEFERIFKRTVLVRLHPDAHRGKSIPEQNGIAAHLERLLASKNQYYKLKVWREDMI